MASYHCSIKTGSRGKGNPHAEYITREGKFSKGEMAEELVYKEHGNMPEWAKENPQDFWKSADEYERANGTAYRELEIAIPNELTQDQQKELVKEFVEKHIGEDHPYTYAIHEKDATLDPSQRQPHAHIMFCDRKLDGIKRDPQHFFKQGAPKGKDLSTGGVKKDARWNGKNRAEHYKMIRHSWAEMQNHTLEKYGHEARVDHRSLKEQRADALAKGDIEKAELLHRVPEKHLGPKASNKKVISVLEYRNMIKEWKALQQEIKLAGNQQTKLTGKELSEILGKHVTNIENQISEIHTQKEEFQTTLISPKGAYVMAISEHTKGETKRIDQESKAIKKAKEELGGNNKELNQREKKNLLDINQMKEYLNQPKVKAEIEKIQFKILEDNQSKLTKIKELEGSLAEWHDIRKDLKTLQLESSSSALRDKPIEFTGEPTPKNIIKQLPQIQKQIKTETGQKRDKGIQR